LQFEAIEAQQGRDTVEEVRQYVEEGREDECHVRALEGGENLRNAH
jgi:hypothetical protein